MQEEFLHFIWKYRMYQDYLLFNADDDGFDIISQGEHNFNSGPDFLAAKIKMAQTTWVGNVEIHLKSSDWYLHKHHLDKAYNNVILQVVQKHDQDIYTEEGRLIPVMEIKVANSMEEKFLQLKQNGNLVPCQDDINKVNEFKRKMWFGNVLIERLTQKADHVIKILEQNKNNWEETFYQLLARSFGFKVNSEPFEWLAKSIPLKYMAKHQNNLLQLEAMLFGQAGFLDTKNAPNEYYNSLQKEYQLLSKKFSLIPIERHLWKFMRLRPSNFPYIRISQFAVLVNKSKSLFSKILNINDISAIIKLFDIKATQFWDNHYTFEKPSVCRIKILGKSSINSLMINTIIPVLFVYGQQTDNESIKDKALRFLEEIQAENNNILSGWTKVGIEIPSAYYSQALIQQWNAYCKPGKCLKCGIGIEILKNQLSKV